MIEQRKKDYIVATMILLGMGAFSINNWVDEHEENVRRAIEMKNAEVVRQLTLEKATSIQQLKDNRTPATAYFQDTNNDGTNEIIIVDRSGGTSKLFRYDNARAGINNRYFSAEEIGKMKAGELEREMSSYTNNISGGQIR